MTAPARAEQQPRAIPQWEARCRACRGWLVTIPAGTPWARARCWNRQVDGVPGKKCRLYGSAETYKYQL